MDITRTLLGAAVSCTLALTLSACGGGESHDAAYSSTTGSTSTPTALQIASGKVLYTTNCFACHGAGIGSAKSANNILSAIASQGQMKSLSSKIGASQADDIAAYMAFGL